jgi:transposase
MISSGFATKEDQMDAKIRIPHRDQVEMRCESLEQMLTPDHSARAVWEFVVKLDLTHWTSAIASKRGMAGAKALDPRVLVSLWIMATLDGVRSARELSRLTEIHMAYRWICGDEPVNYHSLSDFRNSDPTWLENLLKQTVAALMHAGAADLKKVAQDGMRVRANASSSSFRREKTLRECLAETEEQVAALKEDEGGTPATPRESAARQRAVHERKARVEAALLSLKELQDENAGRYPSQQKDPSEIRVSTTDPDATKMKMADGGYRPAYNVQFATTVNGGVIAGVSVTDEGVDNGQLDPMVEKIDSLYESRPEKYLVDGGFVDQKAIERTEAAGTLVFAPVPCVEKLRAKGQDPYARRPEDTDGVAAWRERMGTEEAKQEYKNRASTAEWVNAQARNHGLRQFLVRGIDKVLSSTFWYALTHNFERHKAWMQAQKA